MTAAIIYARFSPRPDAHKCNSCEKQIERCRKYCMFKGYDIHCAFGDDAISGGVLDRPALSKAIKAIEDFEDDKEELVLVVDSGDRIARDMLINLTIRYQVEKAGGRIEYADGSPTDTTPEGELFVNILAAFAQYERSRIRKRTSGGIKRRQAEGEFFGKPPVGYARDPDDSKKLIPCAVERDAVREARILRKVKWSSSGITVELQRIYGNFRGKPWSARTVRRMISKEHNWEREGNEDA